MALLEGSKLLVIVGNSRIQGPDNTAPYTGILLSVATSPGTWVSLVLTLLTFSLFPLEAPKGNSSSNPKRNRATDIKQTYLETFPEERPTQSLSEYMKWREGKI